MVHWLDAPRYRNEGVTVPRIWVTIVLSLILHSFALFVWVPRMGLLAPLAPQQDLADDKLQVRLAASPPPTPPPPPQETPRQVIAVPRPATPPSRPSRPSAPPVMTAPAGPTIAPPAPAASAAPPAPAAPPQVNPPIAGDLSEYIRARRLERGERDAPPSDADRSQFNASIAANLPRPATGAATQTDKRGGGIFEIKRMDYDDAAFEFFGWNNEMGRKTPQLIEVRKGDNSNMELAVVRRMITIIREYSKEDFIWRSPRRGEDLVLSARLRDNAALESFLLHEFFDDPRQVH